MDMWILHRFLLWAYTVEPRNNTLGLLSPVERLSSFGDYFVNVLLLDCPLLRGLSSFGVSLIGSSTVTNPHHS